MNKKILIACLIVFVYLVGCTTKETSLPIEDHNLLYFLDSGSGQLKPLPFDKNPNDLLPFELAEDIISQLQNGVKNSLLEPALESSLVIEQINILNHIVFINFDKDYYLMSPIKELQTRTAIVRSLTSFDVFKEVEFFIDSKPLVFDEIEMGRMSKRDVLLTFDESIQGSEYQNAVIYYPDPNIDKLIETDVVIDIAPNKKIEEIIIDQLKHGEYQVLPDNVELLNVYTHNGICFIDFSPEFLTMTLEEGMSERLLVYSIVNSLIELDHVSTVQILINGKVVSKFKSNFDMNRLFVKNYSLINHDSN